MDFMDLQRWYIEGQKEWVKENNAKIGDSVLIMRGCKSSEMGCSCAPCDFLHPQKQEQVRKVVTIDQIQPSFISSNDGEHVYCWPWFCLELVEHAQPEFRLPAEIQEIIDKSQFDGCEKESLAKLVGEILKRKE